MTESISPKIFVIILNFNGASTLNNCLTSVFKSDYPNFEIVVVDNDSKDDSFEKARLKYSRVHFIRNSSNVGFSKGNNIGIRYALEKFADYVFVLNNDTIIEETTLSLLARAVESTLNIGIVNPLILGSADNEDIWFAGGLIDWKKMKTTHLIEASSITTPYQSEYLTGCAMFIKKDVFKKIGLFDERFFLYYEDADFSVRAKNAGFDLLIVPTARIRHLEQSNTNNPAKLYWLVLSGIIFFKSHASFMQKIWILLYLPLRKIKNFYDIHFSSSVSARNVHRAYKDFKKIK
jgi:GT2 family glycosyltransferase